MLSKAAARYLPNPFLETGPQAAGALTPEVAWAKAAAILPELEECAARVAMPESTGRWQRKYSIYTGLGGICLAQLRLGLFRRRLAGSGDKDAISHITKARDIAQACLTGDPSSQECALFCGTPGYLAVLCVASSLLGDDVVVAEHLQSLLGWSRYAAERGGPDYGPDEMLFGRAGYLYALLWVRSHLGPDKADFDTPLRQVAARLVASGRAQAAGGWPLVWRCFGEPYVGAAHGFVGILAMLFKCWHVLDEPLRADVKVTLSKLMAVRFRSGNLPIVLGDRQDQQVHWCHGAPGMPCLFAAAAEACGDQDGEFRRAAELAGEVVWERGVILKGSGLCHGLAGNGYTFLTLFRMTGDIAHLQRAEAFAALIEHPEVAAATAQQHDPQRMVQGVPDSPRSLMEGSAGVLCYLLDVACPERSAFPAWEI